MKLFGRFLVTHGTISEQSLLEALVLQMDGIPSVAAVVRQASLLPVPDQLAIFERQWSTGAEYRRAAIELGLWSERLHQEIKAKMVEKRKPLGQVMVEMGILTLDQLTKSLDEFIGTDGGKKNAAVTPVAQIKEEGDVDALARNYCTLFDEELYFKLEGLTRQLPGSAGDLRRLIHPVRYLSRLLRLRSSEQAWNEFETTLRLDALERAWSLRNGIVERKVA